jgi:hypothetical protein
MIELKCTAVLFYSRHDEASFFTWAESIPAVSSVLGRGRSIVLCVKSKSIPERSLRELISLFRRYRVSMRQLAQFRTSKNSHWFASPDAFWFKSVFGPIHRPASKVKSDRYIVG